MNITPKITMAACMVVFSSFLSAQTADEILIADTFNRPNQNGAGNMSDGIHSWENFYFGNGDAMIQIQDEHLRLRRQTPNNRTGVTVRNGALGNQSDFLLADGAIEVSLFQIGTYNELDDINRFSISYRASTAEEAANGSSDAYKNGYRVGFASDGTVTDLKHIAIYTGNGNGDNILAHYTFDDAVTSPTVRVEFLGSNHRVWVNDSMVINYTDTSEDAITAAGHLGIANYFASTGNNAPLIDSYSVIAIPEPKVVALMLGLGSLASVLLLRRRR